MEDVEDLLFTEYFVWEHGSSGSTDISCEEYHVPSHVQEHVDYIMPGIRLLPGMNKRAATKTTNLKQAKRDSRTSVQSRQSTVYPGLPEINSTSCDSYIVPECIKGKMSFISAEEPEDAQGTREPDRDSVQYGIPNGTTAQSGNQLGIYESDNEHYSTADLNQYWSVLYPYG